MSKTGILIVEDDVLVAEGLQDILNGNGYNVMRCEDTKTALETIKNQTVELVLLDVNLGSESGFELCRQIRKFSELPILFLTAYNSEMDVVRGFKAGGDDYVTKPFRMQELLVRVEALLRRRKGMQSALLVSGELSYSLEKHQIQKEDRILELTPIELQIVHILLKNWPNTVSRENILYEVWDKDACFVEENTLNVNMSRLRDKLGEFEEGKYIETVRGVGYRWAVHVQKKTCYE